MMHLYEVQILKISHGGCSVMASTIGCVPVSGSSNLLSRPIRKGNSHGMAFGWPEWADSRQGFDS